MITKAQILEIARSQELIPTTDEKDYVLGWLLAGIPQHPELSAWAFKGGTCLKKCFFETYRFSEDLDYTVPEDVHVSHNAISAWLGELATWVESEAGIQFPRDRLNVEEYTNPRGRQSFQARLSYVGPLNLPRHSRKRVKFDITQDEWLSDDTELRGVFHPYGDLPLPPPRVRCYSVNDVLAEKTRALYERQGRARDVYDVVHISREFRDSITPAKAVDLLKGKFRFKKLSEPSVKEVMARIEFDVVQRDWVQQLRHQLPVLPSVEGFWRTSRTQSRGGSSRRRRPDHSRPFLSWEANEPRRVRGSRPLCLLAQGSPDLVWHPALALAPWSGFDSLLATGCVSNSATTGLVG